MYGNTQTAHVWVLVRIRKKKRVGNMAVTHVELYVEIVVKDIFMPFKGKIQTFPLSL